MISDTQLDSVVIRVSISQESTTWLTIEGIDRRVLGFEFIFNLDRDEGWVLFSVGVRFSVFVAASRPGFRVVRVGLPQSPNWDVRYLLPEAVPGWVLELAAFYAPTKVI